MNENDNNKRGRGGQGFAGMDEERQREIASEGGKAAHQAGTAHEFDSEEAREAGRKGGQARRNNQGGQGGQSEQGGQGGGSGGNMGNQ